MDWIIVNGEARRCWGEITNCNVFIKGEERSPDSDPHEPCNLVSSDHRNFAFKRVPGHTSYTIGTFNTTWASGLLFASKKPMVAWDDWRHLVRAYISLGNKNYIQWIDSIKNHAWLLPKYPIAISTSHWNLEALSPLLVGMPFGELRAGPPWRRGILNDCPFTCPSSCCTCSLGHLSSTT